MSRKNIAAFNGDTFGVVDGGGFVHTATTGAIVGAAACLLGGGLVSAALVGAGALLALKWIRKS